MVVRMHIGPDRGFETLAHSFSIDPLDGKYAGILALPPQLTRTRDG